MQVKPQQVLYSIFIFCLYVLNGLNKSVLVLYSKYSLGEFIVLYIFSILFVMLNLTIA